VCGLADSGRRAACLPSPELGKGCGELGMRTAARAGLFLHKGYKSLRKLVSLLTKRYFS